MTWKDWSREVESRGLAGKAVCAYCAYASVQDYIPSPKMLCLRDDMKRGKYVDLGGNCERHKKIRACGQ